MKSQPAERALALQTDSFLGGHQLKMGILVKHHETWDDGFDYQQTNAEKQIP
jgi:hypothetical protein